LNRQDAKNAKQKQIRTFIVKTPELSFFENTLSVSVLKTIIFMVFLGGLGVLAVNKI